MADVRTGQRLCGCGHRVADHDAYGCPETRRPPDVLTARRCGCRGAWRPPQDDSRYRRWSELELRAGGDPS